MANKKEKNAEDVQKIREGLDETNGAHQPAINQQLDGLVNMMKKYIIVKQTKLDKYLKKLSERTNDDVAVGVLENINMQLNQTGEKYAAVLKFESEKKPTTEAGEMEYMIHTSSELSQLVLELQKIEDILNTCVGKPQ